MSRIIRHARFPRYARETPSSALQPDIFINLCEQTIQFVISHIRQLIVAHTLCVGRLVHFSGSLLNYLCPTSTTAYSIQCAICTQARPIAFPPVTEHFEIVVNKPV